MKTSFYYHLTVLHKYFDISFSFRLLKIKYDRRMQCVVTSVLLLVGLVLLAGADEEKTHATGHHDKHDPMDVPKEVDGHHNPEYDEEAMLGEQLTFLQPIKIQILLHLFYVKFLYLSFK